MQIATKLLLRRLLRDDPVVTESVASADLRRSPLVCPPAEVYEQRLIKNKNTTLK